jgi:hypothetical protein
MRSVVRRRGTEMQDAFGVERSEVSKAEGTKWRLSPGEKKAAKGSRKDKAVTAGAVGAYGAGLAGAVVAGNRGAEDLSDARFGRREARRMRSQSLRQKGQMDVYRAQGNKKAASETMRRALRSNTLAVETEKWARPLARSGKGKLALAGLAGTAGVTALAANSNAQQNRVNAYRKSKGEAPRSKWTGFPKD